MYCYRIKCNFIIEYLFGKMFDSLDHVADLQKNLRKKMSGGKVCLKISQIQKQKKKCF